MYSSHLLFTQVPVLNTDMHVDVYISHNYSLAILSNFSGHCVLAADTCTAGVGSSIKVVCESLHTGVWHVTEIAAPCQSERLSMNSLMCIIVQYVPRRRNGLTPFSNHCVSPLSWPWADGHFLWMWPSLPESLCRLCHVFIFQLGFQSVNPVYNFSEHLQ